MTLVHIKLVVTVFAVTLFFKSGIRKFKKINFSEFVPGSDADMVKVYRLRQNYSHFVSSKMLDYTTVDFPFTEFPKGIDVTYLIKRKHS
jgi:hypothetical protein